MKTTKLKTLIIGLAILFCGICIGCHKDDLSFINGLRVEETTTCSMSPASLPAPTVNYQRMNVYGKYYIIFTTSQGGIFVIKE
jgi:hypothetical protein